MIARCGMGTNMTAATQEGADGVATVMTMLRTELEMAMALVGRRTLKEIDRSVLWT